MTTRSKAFRRARKARCRICHRPIWETPDKDWMHVDGLDYVDDDVRIHDAEPGSEPAR